MQGTFEIKSESKNYKYTNSQLIVTGSYTMNMSTNNIAGNNGSAWNKLPDGSQGDYIGDFSGSPKENGDIYYSLSAMSRQDSNKVWDAIDEIEAYILGEND